MSDFFDGIDGENEYSAGKPFVIIPDGTKTTACVTGIEYKAVGEEYADEIGAEVLSIDWKISSGEFKDVLIKSSAKINHSVDEKRKKARRMIAAMLTICGKDIKKIKGESISDDKLSAAICNKDMLITVGLMETKKTDENGEERIFKTNFISKIEKIEVKKDEDDDDDLTQ